MKPAVILIMIIMTMLVKMMTMSNFDLSYLALFQMAKLIDIKITHQVVVVQIYLLLFTRVVFEIFKYHMCHV